MRAAAAWGLAALAAGCGGGPAAPPAAGPGAMSHALLDGLLGRRVRGGLVDYAGLKGDPDLAAYLDLLAATPAGSLSGRAERLAYWINAYNAFVLEGVVDHYPVRSIKEIGALGRFTFFRGLEFRAGGRGYTLDAIEHKILRNEFREPRVHFALVCASRGCPRLRAAAYHAESLEEELEAATRAFVLDPERVRLDTAAGVLELSPIFEWYGEDFERAAGSVTAFLRRLLPADQADYLARTKVAVRYLDYDWSLNDLHPPAGHGGG